MDVFIVFDKEDQEVISVHKSRYKAEEAAAEYIEDCINEEFTGFIEDYSVSVVSYEVKE